MAWKKSPESLRQAFNGAVPNDAAVERRQDDDVPTALVGGHLFAMIQGEEMVLRLAPSDREALLAFAGAAPFERSPGEFDREYVVVPTSMLGAMDELRAWTMKAFQHAQQLVALREEEEQAPREVFRLVRKSNAVVKSLTSEADKKKAAAAAAAAKKKPAAPKAGKKPAAAAKATAKKPAPSAKAPSKKKASKAAAKKKPAPAKAAKKKKKK